MQIPFGGIEHEKYLIEALQDAGLRTTVKVIIGGAPVTHRFTDRIGADGYADNAGDAASLAKRLLAET